MKLVLTAADLEVRRAVRQMQCTACNAKPGEKCVGSRGRLRSSSHIDRWVAYRALRYASPSHVARH